MEILTSATKLVFIAITLAVIVATFTGHLESGVLKDLAIMVFSFYFGQKVTQPIK